MTVSSLNCLCVTVMSHQLELQVGPIKVLPLYSTLPPAQQQKIFDAVRSFPGRYNIAAAVEPGDDCKSCLARFGAAKLSVREDLPSMTALWRSL